LACQGSSTSQICTKHTQWVDDSVAINLHTGKINRPATMQSIDCKRSNILYWRSLTLQGHFHFHFPILREAQESFSIRVTHNYHSFLSILLGSRTKCQY
jgi:hypothetical protein